MTLSADMHDKLGSKLAHRRGKFFHLFLALLAFIVVYPFFDVGTPRTAFLIVIAVAIPAAGVYAVSDNRRNLVIAVGLGALSVVGGLETKVGLNLLPGVVLSLVFALIFYLFVVTVIMQHVMSRDEVMGDTLFGAACVYLLLGLVWMVAFTLLEHVQPGSFQFASQGPSGVATIFDFLYYSFTTLTTLGYGDVTPLTPRARSLAVLEAIAGVLYVALLIARLVGMYGQRRRLN